MADVIKANPGAIWLISGDQWFGAHHPFESYEGSHPASFRAFFEKVRESMANKKSAYSLILASGDRHLAEIQKIKPFTKHRYETFELTSSGIHARVYADTLQKFPSKNALAAAGGVLNYMIISSTANEAAELQVKSVARNQGEVLFEREMKVKAFR